MKKAVWILILALLIATGASAEGTVVITQVTPPPTTAEMPQTFEVEESDSMQGSGALLCNDAVYMVLNNGELQNLYRTALNGESAPTLVDTASEISNLVAINNDVYYLRKENGKSAVAVRKADGTKSIVTSFTETDKVHSMSSYKTDLLLIVNDQMHIVYTGNGLCLKLLGAKMAEYVVVGDYAYYSALGDTIGYETASLQNEGEKLSRTAGCLYRLNLSTGNPSLLLKTGVSDLKYKAGKLYFHNISDNYVMGSGEAEWMEGRLYAYNIATGMQTRVKDGYDWGFYPTKDGVMVYTSESLDFINPESVIVTSQANEPLYKPEGYATLEGVENGVAVYEPTYQKLSLVYSDGTAQTVYSGDLMSAQAEAGQTVNPEATPLNTLGEGEEGEGESGGWFGTPKPETQPASGSSFTAASTTKPTSGTGTSTGSGWTTTTTKPTSKPTAKATTKPSSGKDSSYIFPNSSKKKLTRDDILSLDRSMWGYARNEIYARHGYKFTKKIYKDYFAKKSWYKPGGFSTKDLNDIEWYNMDLIKAMEAEFSGGGGGGGGTDSSYIFPNSSKKKLTRSDVLSIDRSLWGYARNEIYARHGYKFTTQKYKDYFAKKSWYKAGGFSTKDLNDIEWYNMDLIKAMEKEFS